MVTVNRVGIIALCYTTVVTLDTTTRSIISFTLPFFDPSLCSIVSTRKYSARRLYSTHWCATVLKPRQSSPPARLRWCHQIVVGVRQWERPNHWVVNSARRSVGVQQPKTTVSSTWATAVEARCDLLRWSSVDDVMWRAVVPSAELVEQWLDIIATTTNHSSFNGYWLSIHQVRLRDTQSRK